MSKIKTNSDGTYAALTKGEIREAALKYFTALGWECWRNNNTSPTRRRTFIGRYGVSDIIGFGKRIYIGLGEYDISIQGRFMAIEVKTQGDKLSDDQKKFLKDLNNEGGFGYLAEDDKKGGVKYSLYLKEKS